VSQPGESTMWEILRIGATIATPIGLLGFALALAYFLRVRRMKHVEAIVDKLPQEARAQFLDESLRKYGIDASNATREQKLHLIKDEMDKRYRLSKLYTIALAIVFTICFAFAVYVFIRGFPQPTNRNGGNQEQPTQSIVISNTRF